MKKENKKDVKITVKLSDELPSIEERERLRLANPYVTYIWIDGSEKNE